MIEFILPLAEVTKQWGELTMEVGSKASANAEEIGAAAVDYLFYSGYVALAYWWARAVATADAGSHRRSSRRRSGIRRGFISRASCRVIHGHAAAMRSGAGNLLAMPAESFR